MTVSAGFKTGGVHSRVSVYEDFCEALKLNHLWWVTAWMELKRRYRRTSIGPMWSVISNCLFVFFVAVVYSGIFGVSFGEYALYVYMGYISWVFISESVSSGGEVFIREYGILSQIRYPFTGYVLKHLYARLLIFFHNVPLVLVIFIIAIEFKVSNLMFLAGFFALLVNSFFYSIWASIVNAKFRDYNQLVSNVMRFMFFVTPIVWIPSQAGTGVRQLIVQYNPFHHLIDVMRAPLLGETASLISWGWVGGITLLNMILAVVLFKRFRANIVYWCS